MPPEFPQTCAENCGAELRWLSPSVAICKNDKARHKWHWDGRRLYPVLDPAIIDMAMEIRRLEKLVAQQDEELFKLRRVAEAAIERTTAELRQRLPRAA